MAITYGLQVWDTQAFSVLVQNSSAGILDLIDTNEQRARLQQKQCSPTENTLAFAEDLQELADMLSNVHPWMNAYLHDLSEQFHQQSTAVLTINVPEQPSKFTILAYFVMMLARQYHMVTYNAAGDFYILPVRDRVLTSRFPELYKNTIYDIPGDAHIQFMKIYRQALIAEGLVKHNDLIDWDQYSMRDDDCDIKASKMVVEYVKAYFTTKGIEFGFEEDRKIFIIPIKKVGNVEFELILDVWAVMLERGIGRVGLYNYLSVRHEEALQVNEFLQHTDEKFKQYFERGIQPLSILAEFDLFDYRGRLNHIYSVPRIHKNVVYEYSTWADLFDQIEELKYASQAALSDIHDVEDFLMVIKESLDMKIKLDDIFRFQMRDSMCVCYLMYVKLFQPNLLPVLAEMFRKKYLRYKDSHVEMFEMMDYIQNYELPT
ncbi:MAG: hypothetical protein VXW65_07515 [Pseudomonadota bacterium]|nr:hypothetical protein [Pseudomonadota bacterium]